MRREYDGAFLATIFEQNVISDRKLFGPFL